MTAVLQRVKNASVTADGKAAGKIGQGLLVLLGVAQGDSRTDAELLAAKILNCRIFEDEQGKMNRSVKDVKGGVLTVSNFTLLANYKHGNRPDFFGAAAPEAANELYEYFLSLVKKEVEETGAGVFGADMKIEMTADGPVTVIMESEVLKKKGEKA